MSNRVNLPTPNAPLCPFLPNNDKREEVPSTLRPDNTPYGYEVRCKHSDKPMGADVFSSHRMNDDDFPTGGDATATGMLVVYQDGPTRQEDGTYIKNGAFVEDLLVAAHNRLLFFQTSDKVKCEENAEALKHIEAALGHVEAAFAALNARRNRRIAEGKYGTNNM